MRRERLLSVLFVALTCLAPSVTAADDDVARLIESIRTHPEPPIRAAAIEALQARGSAVAARGIPAIIEAMVDSKATNAVRSTAGQALRELHAAPELVVPAMIAALAHTDDDVRFAAAWVLDVYDVKSDRDIAAIIEAMGEPGPSQITRYAISKSVAKAGPAAFPRLLAVATDVAAETGRRIFAIQTIGRMTPFPREAVVPLVAALADPKLRGVAIVALGSAGPAAAPAVDGLIAALDVSELRPHAAHALGNIGPAAARSVPKLMALLDAADLEHQAAAKAITAIASISADEAVVARLLVECESSRLDVPAAAARALLTISDRSPDILPRLVRLYTNGSKANLELRQGFVERGAIVLPHLLAALRASREDRHDLGWVLRDIGRPAAAPVAAILEDRGLPVETRILAADVLRRLMGNAGDTIPAMSRTLSDPATPADLRAVVAVALLEQDERSIPFLRAIVKALRGKVMSLEHEHEHEHLAKLGARAHVAMPELIEALDDAADTGKQNFAARSLAAFGPAAKPAIPALRRVLKQANAPTVHLAATALARIGPDAAPAIPELIDVLDQTPAAVEALTAIGAASVPALSRILETSGDSRRAEAVEILGKLGTSAKAAIPALAAMIREPAERSQIHLDAVAMLEKFGADAEEALPAMAKMLRNEHEDAFELYRPATKAIAAIAQDAQEMQAISVLPELRDAHEALRSLDSRVRGPVSAARADSSSDAPRLPRPSYDDDELSELTKAVSTVSVSIAALDAFRLLRLTDDDAPGPVRVDAVLAARLRSESSLIVNGSPLAIEQNGETEITFLGRKPSPGLNVITTARENLNLLAWMEGATLQSFENPYETSYAVLVAIDDYDRRKDGQKRPRTGFAPLGQMVPKAEALKKALIGLGFPEKNIITIYDQHAVSTRIERELKSFWTGGDRSHADRVFFYFGGHGSSHKGTGLLVTYDYERSQPTLTSLLMNDLTRRHSDQIEARHVLIALDACSSGLAVARALDDHEKQKKQRAALRALSVIRNDTKPRARNVLVAGTGDQNALYDNGGIFTEALISGLLGSADLNRDRIIQFGELAVYVKDEVAFSALKKGIQQSAGSYKLSAAEATGEVVFIKGGEY
jgi:hypothetical protein